jgi:transcriptional regulator with XRE-family HTH domain
MAMGWYEEGLEELIPEQQADAERETVAFEYMLQLERLMYRKGITQAELAKRLGKSEGRVSQMFDEGGNPTVKTLVSLARALDVQLSVLAHPRTQRAVGLVSSFREMFNGDFVPGHDTDRTQPWEVKRREL